MAVMHGRAAVALTAAIAMCLAGCAIFRNPTDPNIAFRSVDGGLEVAVCRDLAMTKVWLEQRTGGGEWEDVWKGNAPLELAKGESFTSALLPANIVFGEPRMEPGDELDILLSSSDSKDLGISAETFIPAEGMPTDKWLMSDGTVRDEPCDAAEKLREDNEGD